MNTEEQYSELLFKYFSGVISEQEKHELLLWLKENEEHKYLMDRMSDWWAVAHIPLFRSDLEADFNEHFYSLLNPSLPIDDKKAQKRTFFNAWVKIAAVGLLLVTVGSTAFFIGRTSSKQTSFVTYTETEVPYGSQARIVLPDSSVVRLNAGSSLKYKSDYNQSDRSVELRGEACFDVSPNAQKPFFVTSDKLHVRVEGTTFNVKAYDSEETIDIVLVSGKINVLLTDKQEEEVSLIPNQQLSYNKQDEKMNVSFVNASNSILWTNGGLYFEEKTFPEIARELERKYAVNIEIRSNSLAKEVFTGTFLSDYTLNQILQEIDVDKKYRHIYKNGKIIITDK